MPDLAGIHHVKIPVSDLSRSVRWYREVFGMRPTLQFADSSDGVVRGAAGDMPGLGRVLVALRENPVAATGCKGFDPVGFAVNDRADLEQWATHLDGLGIPHSPVIDASIGWLLVFDDPDGVEIHLYTWEAHGIDQSGRPGYGMPVADPETWEPDPLRPL
ncbi:VOC family protein [Nocardia cyriacigeorgica]|uniref:VOC family protein n=1 Tax=Nocardia cyriacigeorgica TaxID=135487 RepID=UPI0013D18E1B|nr:VOC family protein [Nocardia cyriacigeorgica]NEW27709.1 VOC family protein [Nocardia cyriacigeorgica]